MRLLFSSFSIASALLMLFIIYPFGVQAQVPNLADAESLVQMNLCLEDPPNANPKICYRGFIDRLDVIDGKEELEYALGICNERFIGLEEHVSCLSRIMEVAGDTSICDRSSFSEVCNIRYNFPLLGRDFNRQQFNYVKNYCDSASYAIKNSLNCDSRISSVCEVHDFTNCPRLPTITERFIGTAKSSFFGLGWQVLLGFLFLVILFIYLFTSFIHYGRSRAMKINKYPILVSLTAGLLMLLLLTYRIVLLLIFIFPPLFFLLYSNFDDFSGGFLAVVYSIFLSFFMTLATLSKNRVFTGFAWLTYGLLIAWTIYFLNVLWNAPLI